MCFSFPFTLFRLQSPQTLQGPTRSPSMHNLCVETWLNPQNEQNCRPESRIDSPEMLRTKRQWRKKHLSSWCLQ